MHAGRTCVHRLYEVQVAQGGRADRIGRGCESATAARGQRRRTEAMRHAADEGRVPCDASGRTLRAGAEAGMCTYGVSYAGIEATGPGR